MRLLDPDEAADHLNRLWRLAWSLSGSRHLAEDLTQETYARVLARPRRLRNGNEFQYLARTLHNVLNDHLRAERRKPVLVTDEYIADLPRPRGDDDPELASYTREVYAAIGRLPEPLRAAVAAVDVAGMTYAEAATQLRIPPGTVMSRLHRGRARLADALSASAIAA
jgi:RNA polymerase sigma-70 factor, ECF subfamily